MKEDKGNFKVFNAVSTATENAHRLGGVSLHEGEVRLDARREEGAARATDAAPRLVAAVEEAILKQEGGAVAEKGVPLHLTKPDTTALFPSLHWLPSDAVNGTKTPHLELVGHHVSQPLVVDHSHENLCTHLNS